MLLPCGDPHGNEGCWTDASTLQGNTKRCQPQTCWWQYSCVRTVEIKKDDRSKRELPFVGFRVVYIVFTVLTQRWFCDDVALQAPSRQRCSSKACSGKRDIHCAWEWWAWNDPKERERGEGSTWPSKNSSNNNRNKNNNKNNNYNNNINSNSNTKKKNKKKKYKSNNNTDSDPDKSNTNDNGTSTGILYTLSM